MIPYYRIAQSNGRVTLAIFLVFGVTKSPLVIGLTGFREKSSVDVDIVPQNNFKSIAANLTSFSIVGGKN
jgi:hypothetical protein